VAAPMVRLADRLRAPVDKPGIDPISLDGTNARTIQNTLAEITGTLIAGVPVIVGDWVAEYYYNGTDKEYWEIKDDFPCMVPPFRKFWVEWTAPSQIRSSVYGINHPQTSTFTLSGVLVTVATTGERIGYWSLLEQDEEYRKLTEGADFLWRFQPVGFVTGKMAEWAGHDGVFAIPAGDYWIATTKEGAILHHICTAFSDATSVAGGPYVNLLGKEAPLFTHPALLTLTMLNLKNGALTPAALHVDAKYARAYRKRRQQDLVRYHTVVVDPGRTRKPSVAGAGGDRHMPLHLVRGHVQTYADADGHRLFGKYAGTYFIAPHARGNSKEGISHHDYKVKPA